MTGLLYLTMVVNRLTQKHPDMKGNTWGFSACRGRKCSIRLGWSSAYHHIAAIQQAWFSEARHAGVGQQQSFVAAKEPPMIDGSETLKIQLTCARIATAYISPQLGPSIPRNRQKPSNPWRRRSDPCLPWLKSANPILPPHPSARLGPLAWRAFPSEFRPRWLRMRLRSTNWCPSLRLEPQGPTH